MEILSGITLEDLVGRIVKLLAVLSIFVEITPIKICPWSGLLKWIGKKVNGDLIDRVKAVENKVTELQEETKEREAVNARIRILRFGDEIRIGSKHTKEHFEQIIKDIDYYNEYCESHPKFKNSITVMTTKHINDIYNECLNKNSFLK